MNNLNETGPFQPGPVDEVVAAIPQHIGRYRVEKVLGWIGLRGISTWNCWAM